MISSARFLFSELNSKGMLGLSCGVSLWTPTIVEYALWLVNNRPGWSVLRANDLSMVIGES